MEPSTRTLAPITSTNEAKASMSTASSTASRTSDSPSKSPLWRLPPDVLTNLQPSYWTRRSSHGPPDGGPAGAVPPAGFALISFPVPTRFSLGWYVGRVYGLLAGSLVLLILLAETTMLYGQLLRAVLAQRREREARLMTGDAVSASIAHEVRQPLSAMITNAGAGLRWLDRVTPDLDEAKAALKKVVTDGHRADAVIENVRTLFKKDPRTWTSLAVT